MCVCASVCVCVACVRRCDNNTNRVCNITGMHVVVWAGLAAAPQIPELYGQTEYKPDMLLKVGASGVESTQLGKAERALRRIATLRQRHGWRGGW